MESGPTSRVTTRGSWRATVFGTILGLIALLLSPVIALADDIDVRYINVNIDNITVNPGQTASNITYFIIPKEGDGDTGCNWDDEDDRLRMDVVSSNTNVARVNNSTSVSRITLEGEPEVCRDTASVSVRAIAEGTATISLTNLVDNVGGSGTFNVTPATFTFTVNAAPTVSVTGFTNGAVVQKGVDLMPSVGCSVTDDQTVTNPPQPQINTSQVNQTTGLGTVSVTCSYTDAYGRSGTNTRSFSIVDTRAPVIAFAGKNPAANDIGWNKGSVTLSWTCTDAGVGAPNVSQTVSAEGVSSVTAFCQDIVGNKSGTDTQTVKIDKTAPTITFNGFNPAFDGDWSRANPVDLSWTCADVGSGPKDAILTDEADAEGRDANEFSKVCTDLAGNESAPNVVVVSLDSVPPSVVASADPAPNAAGWNKSNVTVSFDCSDEEPGSGLADNACPEPELIDEETNGINVSATIFDIAGNSKTSNVITVKLDKTAPTLAVTRDPEANAAGWNNTDVDVSWTCEDGLSGVVAGDAEGEATLSASADYEVDCADKAGNTDSETLEVLIDKVKPTVGNLTQSDPTGANGWSTGPVTVSWTCSDDNSGVVAGQVTEATVSAEGVSTVTASCTDKAGNVGTDTTTVRIDTVDPGISFVGQSPDANSAGWNNGDVTLTWDCTDTNSGPVAATVTRTATGEGENLPYTGVCIDAAGNENSDTQTVDIDRTAPTTTFLSHLPAPNDDGWNDDASVTLTWTCADALSGAVDDEVARTLTDEGQASVTATCFDRAGNAGTSGPRVVKIDRTAPTITNVALDPAANAAGWNKSTSVELTWECMDANGDAAVVVSGAVAASGARTISGQGTHDETIGCQDRAGNSATSQVTVKIDSVNPTITALVNPAPNAAGWNKSDVTVSFSCADETPSSGLTAACPADHPVTENTDADGELVTRAVGDMAGNTAMTQVTVKLDETAPTIGAVTRDVQPNSAGWHTTAVTVSWTCADDLSGIIAGQLTSATFSTEALWVFTPQCRDVAGNVANGAQQFIFIDLTAPGIAYKSRTAANAAGWNNGPVTVTWACTDARSGPVSPSVSTTVSTEGANQSAAGTCTDIAGNTAGDTQTGINIDTTAPGIAFQSRTAANAAGWNTGAVTVTWDCSDGLSGPVSATVTETASDEGAGQSLTGTCADVAGNTKPDTQGDISIDLTNPTVGNIERSVEPNRDGYNNTDVTVSWTCADALSGVSSAQAIQSRTVSAAGDTTVTPTCTDVAGRTATAAGELVKIDKTAPTVTFDGVVPGPNAAGWNNTQPVTLTWTCADDRSGVVATTRTRAVEVDGTFDDLTATCTDKAGNQTTSDPETVKLDTVAPTVTGNPDRAANGNGWYNADVTVSFSCGDAVPSSGVAICPDAVVVDDNTAVGGQAVVGTASDTAGNTTTSAPVNVKLDETAPAITYTGRTAANAAGWNSGAVTVTWNCADALSGPNATSVSATVSDEGANLPATGTCADKAGNTSSNTQGGINIDLTKPVAPTFNAVAAGTTYVFGSVPAGVTCSSSDALSGLTAAGCVVTGYATTVGSHTLTATATDKAGNVETSQLTYTVAAWTLQGFYQPVDMSTATNVVVNTVKSGSTVPLKFEVFAGSTEQTSTSAVKSFTAQVVNCSSLTGTQDEIEVTSTGGTSLRYDATGGQFIQNWQTPRGMAGSCYKVTMTTQDGSTLVANFKLK